MNRLRHRAFRALLTLSLILGVAVLGASLTPAAAAPKGAKCSGSSLAGVYRSDFTPFASVKECADYVKAGGTLRQPAIAFTLHVHFGAWCEISYGPVDFPSNVTVSIVKRVYLSPDDYVMEFDRSLDGSGLVVHADGTHSPVFGGNSVHAGGHMTVTATFPGGAGPITVTGDYACERK